MKFHGKYLEKFFKITQEFANNSKENIQQKTKELILKMIVHACDIGIPLLNF